MLLPTLVSADACVAGGPADEVSAALQCCASVNGVWYQFYPVQAICVMDATLSKKYQRCVYWIPSENGVSLDTTCVPGSGGLTGGSTLYSTVEAATTTFVTLTTLPDATPTLTLTLG